MYEDVAIEIARTVRELEARVAESMAARQDGELFDDVNAKHGD